MMERLIPIVLGLLLVCGGLFVLSDSERLQAARTYFGLSAREASLNEVERMQPELLENEIARLAALPVPGMTVPEGSEPVELGVLASRARDCALESGGSIRPPKERARAGVMRYLLVLGRRRQTRRARWSNRGSDPLASGLRQGP